MRLLKRLFVAMVGVLAALALIYLLWVVGRLLLASWQLQSDLSLVNQLVHRPQHAQQCFSGSEGALGNKLALAGYQLRFVDDTHYVVEAVCGNQSAGPFAVKEGILPWMVRKVSGSGVLIELPLSPTPPEASIELRADFLSAVVGYWKGVVGMRITRAMEPIDPGPAAAIATCTGWGYQCCDQLTQVGVGDALDKVSDCRDSCYSVCKEKPILVFFGTDPLADPKTRVLTLTGTRVSVAFSYAVQDTDGNIANVHLDFGDGQKYDDTTGDGSVVHEYMCRQSQCVYEAVLTGVDDEGFMLTQSRLNTVKIVLSN